MAYPTGFVERFTTFLLGNDIPPFNMYAHIGASTGATPWRGRAKIVVPALRLKCDDENQSRLED